MARCSPLPFALLLSFEADGRDAVREKMHAKCANEGERGLRDESTRNGWYGKHSLFVGSTLALFSCYGYCLALKHLLIVSLSLHDPLHDSQLTLTWFKEEIRASGIYKFLYTQERKKEREGGTAQQPAPVAASNLFFPPSSPALSCPRLLLL